MNVPTIPIFVHRGARGTALLPALLIVGMVTLVVVLFFSMSTVQLRSSASHAAAHDLNTLQDMAVNAAIAQMRQGTTETDALWISQPGAIRTYGSNTGTASRIYKLYSAQEMVVSAAGVTDGVTLNLESDVPPSWDAQPGVYADLNEPALDDAGNLLFPVVDPRAMDMAAPTYPGSTTPEGFAYDSKLAVSKSAVNGVKVPGSAASSQRLPMPVRWIYILQDGSLGVMSAAASPKFVPFSGQKAVSASNPIVGRLAFWTDDESGKVNINTASEGMFWDTPRCVTSRELEFARNPPVRNEVQRFGGHPATTCLSTIFYPGELLRPTDPASVTRLQNLYGVTPRVNANAGLLLSNNSPVVFDTDRLYASADELLLDDPSDTTSKPLAFTSRTVQGLLAGDAARLKKLRFLLTAESRSPETTAAGLPRVSVWPVSYRTEPTQNKRTTFDNVSAFASTLGNHPFHFRRSSAASNMDDFSNYYNTPDTDSFGFGMIHNNMLAQYLIAQAKLARQGYAKSFAQKYDERTNSAASSPYNTGSGIVAMLEYIRGTNANDSTHSTKNVTPRVPVDAYSQASSNWIGTDTLGQVAAVDMTYYSAPLNTDNKILKRNTNDDGNDRVWTTGIGREFTVSEFGLVFILAAENPSGAGAQLNPELVSLLNLQPGQKAIQVGIVAEGFCPAQGYTMIAPSTSFNVGSLENLRISSTSWGARGPGGAIIKTPRVQKDGDGDVATPYRSKWGILLHNVSHLQYLCKIKPMEKLPSGRNSTGGWWTGWGGSGGYWMYADSDANGGADAGEMPDLDVGSASLNSPAMYSRGYFLVPSSATSMTVSSVRTTSLAQRCLEIRVGNQRNGDYSSRRLMVEVPANMVVPVPTKPLELGHTFSKRYKDARGSGGDRFLKPDIIDSGDVVRTWVVRHGDYRLAYQRLREGAGAAGVDPNKRLFVPHPAWDPASLNAPMLAASQLKPQIHSFVKSGGKPHPTGKTGSEHPPIWGDGTSAASLVPDADYGNLTSTTPHTSDYRPDFPVDGNSAVFRANIPSNYPYSVKPWETRDWDNGTGIAPDGAYWNKPDDGARISDGTIPPYFTSTPWDGVNINNRPANQTTAPNQLIPSPVMFGSLPSAPSTGIQWTTYLFRPDITPGGHLGTKDHSTKGPLAGAPPDHALLDWFWMPVVQPYPISEPFSTAGKINLNYRIVPFTNIKRATGLHAVLKSEELLAIPTSAGKTYKDYTKISLNSDWRHHIDADKTLLQWESKFDVGQYFMNAGELCEQFLVPKDDGVSGSTGSAIRSAMVNYWATRQLTGDNTMERPYANIYPRVTTRSNTYRVHFLVQTITKARSSDAETFDPNKDLITGEKQGDALVERAIDPGDAALKTADYDYIGKAVSGSLDTAKSLDTLYTWRIRHVRRFSR